MAAASVLLRASTPRTRTPLPLPPCRRLPVLLATVLAAPPPPPPPGVTAAPPAAAAAAAAADAPVGGDGDSVIGVASPPNAASAGVPRLRLLKLPLPPLCRPLPPAGRGGDTNSAATTSSASSPSSSPTESPMAAAATAASSAASLPPPMPSLPAISEVLSVAARLRSADAAAAADDDVDDGASPACGSSGGCSGDSSPAVGADADAEAEPDPASAAASVSDGDASDAALVPSIPPAATATSTSAASAATGTVSTAAGGAAAPPPPLSAASSASIVGLQRRALQQRRVLVGMAARVRGGGAASAADGTARLDCATATTSTAASWKLYPSSSPPLPLALSSELPLNSAASGVAVPPMDAALSHTLTLPPLTTSPPVHSPPAPSCVTTVFPLPTLSSSSLACSSHLLASLSSPLSLSLSLSYCYSMASSRLVLAQMGSVRNAGAQRYKGASREIRQRPMNACRHNWRRRPARYPPSWDTIPSLLLPSPVATGETVGDKREESRREEKTTA